MAMRNYYLNKSHLKVKFSVLENKIEVRMRYIDILDNFKQTEVTREYELQNNSTIDLALAFFQISCDLLDIKMQLFKYQNRVEQGLVPFEKCDVKKVSETITGIRNDLDDASDYSKIICDSLKLVA